MPSGFRAARCPYLRRDLLLSAVVLFLLSFSWLFTEVSAPNERTRLYLTMAIVDQGQLAVDGPVARFGAVYDLARHRGRFYTDKAPGSSFLAVPVYAAARLLRKVEERPIVDLLNMVRRFLMIPVGLLGFAWLRSSLRALRISEPTTDVVSLGYSLGTSVFHYSTAFYGHVIVATALLGVVRCLIAARVLGPVDALGLAPSRDPSRVRLAPLVGAGALAGLSGLTEYQAVVLALLLAMPVVVSAVRQRRWQGLLAYTAGGVPFAGALLLYNRRAFGGVLELSYHHLVGSSLQALHGSGLAGATHPTWQSLGGVLFSQHRGLLGTSPWLAFGLLGLTLRIGGAPRLLRITLAVNLLSFVLIVASSSVWYGGWSFGPRLLIPVMGFCAIGAASFLDRFCRSGVVQVISRATIILSIFYHQLMQWTFPELPPDKTRPLVDSVLPMLRAGVVGPNLVCHWHAPRTTNLLPAALVVLGVAGFIAWRGARGLRRQALASATCLLASAALLAAFRQPPNGGEGAQQGWLRMMHDFERRETCCVQPSPVVADPKQGLSAFSDQPSGKSPGLAADRNCRSPTHTKFAKVGQDRGPKARGCGAASSRRSSSEPRSSCTRPVAAATAAPLRRKPAVGRPRAEGAGHASYRRCLAFCSSSSSGVRGQSSWSSLERLRSDSSRPSVWQAGQ